MTPVSISSNASADLHSIYAYSFETFGEAVADTYFLDLQAAIERLSDYPELGMMRSDLHQRPRCLPCREHHIFYRYDGVRVVISRILHKRMDPSIWLM